MIDNDISFMSHIIAEICNYVVKNNLDPDETLDTIANNIQGILEVSTFKNWQYKENI